MSTRIDKVNSLLEHEISKLIAREFSFSGGMLTLTHVDTSANLIQTRVYISVLPEDKTEAAVKALNANVHDIQQKLNKMLNMRPIPKIIFVADPTVAEAARIEGLLNQLKKDGN